eukprot:scaffold15366_cov70-Phaeocystis_antarctica.AAC.8
MDETPRVAAGPPLIRVARQVVEATGRRCEAVWLAGWRGNRADERATAAKGRLKEGGVDAAHCRHWRAPCTLYQGWGLLVPTPTQGLCGVGEKPSRNQKRAASLRVEQELGARWATILHVWHASERVLMPVLQGSPPYGSSSHATKQVQAKEEVPEDVRPVSWIGSHRPVQGIRREKLALDDAAVVVEGLHCSCKLVRQHARGQEPHVHDKKVARTRREVSLACAMKHAAP